MAYNKITAWPLLVVLGYVSRPTFAFFNLDLLVNPSATIFVAIEVAMAFSVFFPTVLMLFYPQ